MADFRAFLKPTEPVVLPYFGGTRVDAADRRFKVAGELAPGWWRFVIEGRRAVPKEQTAPLVDFYRQKGLLKSVDGMQPVEEVTAAIRRVVAP